MKKKSSSKIPMNRSQFLKMVGMGSVFYGMKSPLHLFFDGLKEGLMASARAEALKISSKNYVAVLLAGAPPRWLWDGFLTPNGSSDPFILNPSVCNWIAGSTGTPGNYQIDNSMVRHVSEEFNYQDNAGNQKKIWLPPLWNRDIPVVGDGWTPMNRLLSNAVIMRGVDMIADIGHDMGPAKVTRPSFAGLSLSGLASDFTETPLGPVAFQNSRADIRRGGFKAKTIGGPALIESVIADKASPLELLLGPFLTSTSKTTREAFLHSLISKALDDLAPFANSSYPGASILFKNRSRAEDLMKKTFGDLKAQYLTLYNKYRNLVIRANAPIANMILPDGLNLGTSTIITTGGYEGPFAIAEFLIKENLSNSITIGPHLESARNGRLQHPVDEHLDADRQKAVICMSYYFRSISALIYEFRNALGSKWNNTVVHVSAEFGRAPRKDGTGTDHAANSNVVSIFSGAIQGPVFLGNIRTDNGVTKDGYQYTGTYGTSAPLATSSGTILLTNDVASSCVATLLGVPPPTNAPSVIEISDGSKIKSLAEDPKNVA